MKFPKRGVYTGRLAFDPESGFHVDSDGRNVITLDGGTTWRYANRRDASHNARYERRRVTVDSTDNAHIAIVAEHGPAVAEQRMWEQYPHHFEVQPHDAHFDGSAKNKTRLIFHPDVEAPTKTSHTDAWGEAA